MSKSMEGWVEKKANKWKKYYAVMVGKRMYFFKSDKTDDTEQMVGHLEIGTPDAVQAEETKKKYCVFSVASQTGVYLIKVPNEETREKWMAAIQAGGDDVDTPHPSSAAAAVAGASGAGGGALPPALPGNHPSLRKQTGGRPLPPAPGAGASASSGRMDSRLTSGSSSVVSEQNFDTDEPFKSEAPDGSQFSDASWHFGHTSRAVTEKLLARHGSNGSFLLRTSESRPGDYTLSVVDGKAPRHYKVLPQPEGGFVLTGCADMVFADLGKLVDYFSNASGGRSIPLDKFQIEKMEVAFSGPSEVVQGAVLPGMKIAMEMGY